MGNGEVVHAGLCERVRACTHELESEEVRGSVCEEYSPALLCDVEGVVHPLCESADGTDEHLHAHVRVVQ